jgi:SAM-dependent methyltransferase
VSEASGDVVDRWVNALWERHLADLRFPEVRRALQALSALYVERRAGLALGKALDGAGKRAAFAMFYGPMHLAIARHVARATGAASRGGALADLGCGTGAAAAGLALAQDGRASVTGVDLSPWAVAEATWTWRWFGFVGSAHRGRVERFELPRPGATVVVGWVANELPAPVRRELLERLLRAADCGVGSLVLEPIARRVVPWWGEWAEAFAGRGGRDDEWRIPPALPDRWRDLDRAAGLDHRELTARSLYLPAAAPASPSTAGP